MPNLSVDTRETLADVVFFRSDKDPDTLFKLHPELPRETKTLLLAVDGRSPVAKYALFLTSLIPLSAKFELLEQLGFLLRVGGLPVRSISPQGNAADATKGVVPITEAALQALSMAFGFAAVSPSKSATVLEQDLMALAGGPVPNPSQKPSQVRPSATSSLGVSLDPLSALEAAKAEILQFLTAEAQMDGLSLALMLEHIHSIDKLRLEMPDYLRLVEPLGQRASAHIRKLSILLNTR